MLSLSEAKRIAKANSKHGYVQHVNRTCDASDLRDLPTASYVVSDWYDFARTVASFENGKEL